MSDRHEIKDAAKIEKFVKAGRAIFTLQNGTTGNRYTYRVTRAKGTDEGRPHFVSVLTGPDNTSCYTYLGTLFADGAYRHGRKSSIEAGAKSAQGAAWFFRHLTAGAIPAPAQVFHEGRCGKCGRCLTVPSSIFSGLGPICAQGGEDTGAPVPEFAEAA